MSHYKLKLERLNTSFNEFTQQHLPITSNYEKVETFKEFLTAADDRIINERKGELFEYFIHQFLLKNRISSFINKTLVYINSHFMPKIYVTNT